MFNQLAYHDVAYKMNTLAALDIASFASLDTFTPSGICKYKTYDD